MTYYIAPRFLNKLAVHITKNFLDLPGINAPLILGIHGHKGEGKSFQCELVFKRMKVQAIHLSAGELESPDAGDPSRLVRFRYREAADIITKHGKLAVLMINDIDAGAGRVDSGTQYTVNTQLVNATLMNIADNPTNVQLPGSYDSEPLPRVPIIVTGNDFGTLYAPLVRDGRMDKFYWEPNREDRLEIVNGIFTPDGLNRQQIEQLVSKFEGQSIDFFSALRASIYDEQILAFIEQTGFDKIGLKVANSTEKHSFIKPDFRLEHLIEKGEQMVKEQQHIQELRLVAAYNRSLAESNTAQRYGFMPGQPPASGNGIRQENRGSNAQPTASNGSPSAEVSRPQNQPQSATATLDLDAVKQIRQLMAQGYPIGIEHVDRRRFRTGSWQSCGCIQTGNESEAIASLESCLANYAGEYVRLFGIDANKRRVMETIIQRPD
ncbi:ribulose bisphosphate carboxylase small subunit [Laspinema sp. D1]|uniref:Ribulose bisphosphate carboxylase small subunit n=1 Tax=Laspinema palackyanum D2a TaxID=2953684 RepID=A0ABT2MMP1_9CYAN|nr:ribulose bisphosphate carboxylase small subunit [Laspinema sp. D2a]